MTSECTVNERCSRRRCAGVARVLAGIARELRGKLLLQGWRTANGRQACSEVEWRELDVHGSPLINAVATQLAGCE